jgi:tetratricopeptide (TPR) repeat protein
MTSGQSHILFENLKMVNGWKENMHVFGASNYIIIDNCNIDSAIQTSYDRSAPGMLYVGSNQGDQAHNWTITNSTFNYSLFGHAMYWDGVRNVLLDHNIISFNGANGIQIYSAYGSDVADSFIVRYCEIRQNATYGGGECGIFNNSSKNSLFYYNVIENNRNANSDNSFYSGCVQLQNDYSTPPRNSGFYNNTVICHGKGSIAFNLGGDGFQTGMDSLYFKNNIVYLDDVNGWGIDMTVLIGSYSQFTNNLYYPTYGTHLFHLGPPDSTGIDFHTIPDWHSYSYNFTSPPGGYEFNSIAGDPLFMAYADSNYTLKISSPAALTGVWVGLPDQDIVGTLIGDPPDLGAYQKSIYKAGTIAVDTTYSGSIGIVGDLTLSSGKTLTISPGTHFKVKNDANITFHGKLLSQYNSQLGDITFNPIEKYGRWGSIIFDEASFFTSTLQHSTLNNSIGIQCLNGTHVNIEHTTIDSSIQGIYIYNSQANINDNFITNPENYGIFGEASGQNINIERNTITRTLDPEYEALGICLSDYTSVHLTNNYISGFYWGAFMMVETNLETGLNYDATCNNVITGNVYGLGTYGNSTTFAGGYVGNDLVGAFNSIYGNTNYDIYTAASSSFQGYSDYFGGDTKFYADNTSTNDIQYTLSSNPCGTSKKIDNGTVTANSSLKKSGEENLLEGLFLEKQNRIDEAIEYYKGLISSDSHVIFAITRLTVIRNNYSRPELIAYIESLLNTSNKYYSKIKNLLGSIYFQENRFEDGITAFNNVIDRPTEVYDGINARFGKLFGYLNIRNDVQSASQILKEIKAMDPTDRNTLIKIKAAERLLENSNRMNKKFASTNGDIPKTYGLSQNYPNPFNPSTKINYQLPKPGNVSLIIYDILGRQILTLVNEFKSEGEYSVNFNANKLASGVYLYQLRSNGFVSTKKMVLTK